MKGKRLYFLGIFLVLLVISLGSCGKSSSSTSESSSASSNSNSSTATSSSTTTTTQTSTSSTSIETGSTTESSSSQELFTVSFSSNEGSAVTSISDTTINSEPVTTRAGYKFLGWYQSFDFSGDKITFPYTISSNLTFYAKWEKIVGYGLVYTLSKDETYYIVVVLELILKLHLLYQQVIIICQ